MPPPVTLATRNPDFLLHSICYRIHAILSSGERPIFFQLAFLVHSAGIAEVTHTTATIWENSMSTSDHQAKSRAQPSAGSDADAHLVYFGLGSNLGERDRNLQTALDALAGVVRLTAVSSVYDTAPLLITDQPRFHNAVCAGYTSLAPLALLHALKGLEETLGRIQGIRFGPRLIDIDLLFYDQLVLETPELTLPHPRLKERAFVLAPLAEIAPDLMHPVFHVAMSILAAHALLGADIRSLGHLLILPD